MAKATKSYHSLILNTAVPLLLLVAPSWYRWRPATRCRRCITFANMPTPVGW
jgi:hypothetical protein